jgi:hypothetical protein
MIFPIGRIQNGDVMNSKENLILMGINILISLVLVSSLADEYGFLWSFFAIMTASLLSLGGLGLWFSWRAHRQGIGSFSLTFAKIIGILIGLVFYVYFSLWHLRPDLLPQDTYYDMIKSHDITERLVDPNLMKVEYWEIFDVQKEVLFLHPASVGSTALVYPVKIEPKTSLRASLAVAPEAWESEGDGVTFSIYVEDEAGYHIVYSQYVDPKHQTQDRRWLPIKVNLDAFKNKLVRLILVVNNGPAGDGRYDWAGWGKPRLEKPRFP